MDYAPTAVGYWNCQLSATAVNASRASGYEGNATVRVDDTVTAEMLRFGGQSHCPSCRCFVSSLKEVMSASLNPMFPKFGLCYQ
jgi:hypothetical protein